MTNGLHVIGCDGDTIVMNQVAYKFDSFVLYYDHHNHVARNSCEEDIVLNLVNTLPKVLSPRKVYRIPRKVGERLPNFYQNIHTMNSQSSSATGNEGEGESSDDDSEESNFMDFDNDIAYEDDDLFCDNVDDIVADKGLAHGKKISKERRWMHQALGRRIHQAEIGMRYQLMKRNYCCLNQMKKVRLAGT